MSEAADQELLEVLSRLAYANPLLPERIALEREVLGEAFVPDAGLAWSHSAGSDANDRPNIQRITEAATGAIDRVLARSKSRRMRSGRMARKYWDVVTYVLLYKHIIPRDPTEMFDSSQVTATWRGFAADYDRYAAAVAEDVLVRQPADHLFACLCQVHRAFVNIFHCILGESEPIVRLRGAVWQSIFTANLLRYRRSLYDRMSLLPVLITGPTGTGKELVARAVGLSQYIPFDAKRRRFSEPSQNSFFPLNLSAMSPTLIESELFGHSKGAFTGAVTDRAGWLEQCRPHGAVFLDEIGELDPALQVKLLRVVQQRTYSRLGETEQRTFSGKIIGATNRLMHEEIRAGRFREDLYYRLCADRIQTPGLREQLDDCPGDLPALCVFIARRLAGDDGDSLADEALEWIDQNLGADYPWHGNIRELEQCVGSIMIRNHYTPSTEAEQAGRQALPTWLGAARAGTLTAEDLTGHYCHWVYKQTGSYEATGRQVGLDRRTVKSRIDGVVENAVE